MITLPKDDQTKYKTNHKFNLIVRDLGGKLLPTTPTSFPSVHLWAPPPLRAPHPMKKALITFQTNIMVDITVLNMNSSVFNRSCGIIGNHRKKERLNKQKDQSAYMLFKN